MSGAVRWVGKTLVVGVIVALTLSGCSGETTRSALGEDAAQASAPAVPEASTSSSADPSVSGGVDASTEDDGSAPAPGGSSQSPSSTTSGQALVGDPPDRGCVNPPFGASLCGRWMERPASENWLRFVVCPNHYSDTRSREIHNLTTLDLWFAVRELDCNDWSQSGTPAQITGSFVLPGQLRSWSLEEIWPQQKNRMVLGIFLRNPDNSLSQLGEIWHSTNSLQWGQRERMFETNTGNRLPTKRGEEAFCYRQLVGKDPNRSKSTQEFAWQRPYLYRLSFYSDGDDVWAVTCGSGDPTK